MRRFLKSEDDGFTLIELLIVIAILAILVSIVAINVTNVMSNVNDTVQDFELKLVQFAIDQYNVMDVAVNGAAAITANSTPMKLPDASVPFSKYLTNTTRYYYTWGDGGTNLASQATP